METAHCFSRRKLRLHRLNRTMQYGNEKSRHTEIVGTDKFKSYYVVWKRKITPHRNCGNRQRLNRTMQYGNPNGGGRRMARKCSFKSYYVVWKLKILRKTCGFSKMFKSYYVVWKLLFHKKIG